MFKKFVAVLLIPTLLALILPAAYGKDKDPKRPRVIKYHWDKGKAPEPSFYDDREELADLPVFQAVGGYIHVNADPVVVGGIMTGSAYKLPEHQHFVKRTKTGTGKLLTKYGYWIEGIIGKVDYKGNPIYELRNKNTGEVLGIGNCGNPADLPPEEEKKTEPKPEPKKEEPKPEPIVQRARLEITKEVALEGHADKVLTYSSSVEAAQEDVVRYRVTIKNTSTVEAKDILFDDNNLPNKQNFALAGDLNMIKRGNGYIVGNLAPGDSVKLEYHGKVTLESGEFTNTALAWASNADQVSASAKVKLKAKQAITPIKNGWTKKKKVIVGLAILGGAILVTWIILEIIGGHKAKKPVPQNQRVSVPHIR